MMGIILVVAAAGMILSAITAVITDQRETLSLLLPGTILGAAGLGLWQLTSVPSRFSRSSIFATVLAVWVVLSLVGTLPYLLSGALPRFDDALFESISGFTTTGSTVLRPIEGNPAGILFWRALTQWIGGIGVVVLAVSVLPFLGVGGMELLSAEAPGPSSERLAPRVRETAKRLVSFYLALSALVAVLYALLGMTPFLAITHMFTTVSTGGFSTMNGSIGHFESDAIYWVTTLAMLIAGGSYALYWQAIRGRPLLILRSVEMRTYLFLMAAIVFAAVAFNVAREGLSHRLISETAVSVVSVASTTGYTLLDYDQWPTGMRLWILFVMALGGMAGSTTGGFKVFRLLTVLNYSRRLIFLQLHPRAVRVVRIGRDPIPEDIVTTVVGFLGLFMAIGALATFLIGLTGVDVITSISAVAQGLGNVGPGMNQVGPTTDFLNLKPSARIVLMVVMLLGRLEIFPVILGLVPLFRRVGQILPIKIAGRLARIGSG